MHFIYPRSKQVVEQVGTQYITFKNTYKYSTLTDYIYLPRQENMQCSEICVYYLMFSFLLWSSVNYTLKLNTIYSMHLYVHVFET
jgi:hypothetical protein